MTDGERTRGRTTKLWHGDRDAEADDRTALDPPERGARLATVLPDDHRSAFSSHAPPRSPRLRTERRQPALPGTREAPHELSHTQPLPHAHRATQVSPPDTLPAPPQHHPAPHAHAGMRSSARARRVVMLPHAAPVADATPRASADSAARPAAWSAAWKVAAAVCALALAFWGGTRWASRGLHAAPSMASTHALARAPVPVAEPVPVTPVTVAAEPPVETRLDRAPTPQVVDGGVWPVALPGR